MTQLDTILKPDVECQMTIHKTDTVGLKMAIVTFPDRDIMTEWMAEGNYDDFCDSALEQGISTVLYSSPQEAMGMMLYQNSPETKRYDYF
jgi:hypothetical protein